MEVRYIFLHPPVLEEILFSTPLIRLIAKSVDHAEIFSVVPKNLAWVLESNPYVSSQILFDKHPSSSIKEIRALKPDYLIDLTGGKKLMWFKNRLRVMDFTLSVKTLEEFRGLRLKDQALEYYRKEGLKLLDVFDLEDDMGGIDYFYGHNKAFVEQAVPESFIANYAVLDLPDNYELKPDGIEKISRLIGMIERPLVLCGSEKWRKAGEEIMRQTGCTILSTCGDFTGQEQAYVRAEANVLINIKEGMEIWSMVFDKPHFYFDTMLEQTNWKGQVNEIRDILRSK